MMDIQRELCRVYKGIPQCKCNVISTYSLDMPFGIHSEPTVRHPVVPNSG